MPAYNENQYDRADPLTVEQMATASDLMDRIVLLGASIIAMQDADEIDIAKIYEATHKEIRSIDEGLRALPAYTYSIQGKGFVPLADTKHSATTTFALIPQVTGTVHSLVLFDVREVEYTTREEYLEDLGLSEEEADGALLDEAVPRDDALDRIIDPEFGVRLFIDFLTDHRTDPDQCVGGIAVRSNDVTYHNIVDAASLRVNSMYQLQKPEQAVSYEDLASTINEYASRARRMINDNKFRRMSRRDQRRVIEKLIHEANSNTALDRYIAHVKPQRVYGTILQNGERIPKEVTFNDDMQPMTVYPLRMDLFELYHLAQGQRIYNDQCLYNKFDGLCIVAEVPGAKFGTEAMDIIWIPVCSQDLNMSFFEKE